jgi:hypothetical protein
MNASDVWNRSSSGFRCYWASWLSHGVLPLEFKPAYSVGDLLTQHLDELEQEVERKGGVLQTLSDHFAKVFRAAKAIALAA